MQDLPQNLLQQIKDFEDMFTVDRAKLKQIVNHFVKELEKGKCRSEIHRLCMIHCADNHGHIGLSVEGGNIVRTTHRLTIRI